MKPREWERQDNESEEAFQAFVQYRDQGVERTIITVARALEKSRTIIDRWSQEWGWVKRCQAWDNELDRAAQNAQKKDIIDMRKRHASIAMMMQQKVVESIRGMAQSEKLKPDQASKWLDIAVKVERLSRGEATDNVKQMGGGGEAGGFDAEGITVEDLEALERIAAKGRGPDIGGGVEGAPGGDQTHPAGDAGPEGDSAAATP